EKTGRIIPQANEEYGYEDHYPLWAQGPGLESADALRRVAWEIVMAGCYQTAGETARRGTNIWPDTGGGWMNGRGDDTMTMFKGYAHMVDFITSFEWWKTNPHDEMVSRGDYCLAKPGEIYAVYLPHGGAVTVQLERGNYTSSWFDAFTGEKITLSDVQGPSWTSPKAPSTGDWALLLLKK
ncbi:MAG TPA: putative collagen-binding domain-containing protein, partial [Bryobacteraceae bacterium]|nr:putative collagen-binding domain-containing protein [Bryobacteraceae bacterium]